MTQPAIKLTYFRLTVRAELSRLALVYGGINFEDERIPGAVMKELKPKLPLGQLPLLELDGKAYIQSMAIARYAGRLGGIYPSDPVAALKVDMMLETLHEAMDKYVDVRFHTKDAELQAEKAKVAADQFFPKIFNFVEKTVEGKFFFGDEISLADLYLFDVVTNCMHVGFTDFSFDSYPKVQAIVEAVKATPRVAAYLASHA
ncbi:hypothetical protein Poli38472_002377 [Pythium oligandrum]|uniref:Glutathione S-transferase n=1 Tax=Pythium oligandrum TaxID=41045 RepID=A0A8K1FI52_PYTOL|nr:hypothetical protein Poli38472_002377 [Pythium oligandrum]|eukprot:TMW63436.1 hypothetical protein Poli38472_002377 [Pythium oligandrum]